VRELAPPCLAENVGNEPRPTPDGHVDDGIDTADHSRLFCQARVENAEVALRLVHVPIDCVGNRFRCVIPEVYRLARERTDAAGHEHQPGQKVGPRSRAIFGQEFSGFSAKYSRMALLSNTTTSPSTIVGTFALGLIARYSGLC